jgi:hypothetical protein
VTDTVHATVAASAGDDSCVSDARPRAGGWVERFFGCFFAISAA